MSVLGVLRALRMPFKKKVWVGIGLVALRAKSVVRRVFGRPIHSEFHPTHISVFEFTRAGDIVCAGPLFALLKEVYPTAKLTLIGYEDIASVPSGIREVDDVITVDRHRVGDALGRLWSLRHAPGTLVLTHGINPLVAWYCLISNAPAFAGYLWTHRFSLLPGKGFSIEPAKEPFGHLVEHRLEMARALGIDTSSAPPVHFRILPEEIRPVVRQVLRSIDEKAGPVGGAVALVPGSRSLNRQWPAEHYVRLAHLFLEKSPYSLVVVGGEDDVELARKIHTLSPARVVDGTGSSMFMEFAAVLNATRLVICNDSAALHVAAGLRIPCIALFGPVSPEKRIHRFAGYESIGLTGTESCECGHDFFREVPCPHDRKCLRSLTPDRVFETAMKALGAR